nr:hypothetical protein [Candidatus Kuenenia stuttgartiensis]
MFLLYGIDTHLTSLGYAFVFIQLVFAGTAATITSGAYAERAKLLTHICTTIVVVCLIYPVFGHWAWGHLLHTQQYGWLERLGFIDFAGSTVVHSVSGWIALSGAIVLGPRTGKFNPGWHREQDVRTQSTTCHNRYIFFVVWLVWF